MIREGIIDSQFKTAASDGIKQIMSELSETMNVRRLDISL